MTSESLLIIFTPYQEATVTPFPLKIINYIENVNKDNLKVIFHFSHLFQANKFLSILYRDEKFANQWLDPFSIRNLEENSGKFNIFYEFA